MCKSLTSHVRFDTHIWEVSLAVEPHLNMTACRFLDARPTEDGTVQWPIYICIIYIYMYIYIYIIIYIHTCIVIHVELAMIAKYNPWIHWQVQSVNSLWPSLIPPKIVPFWVRPEISYWTNTGAWYFSQWLTIVNSPLFTINHPLTIVNHC